MIFLPLAAKVAINNEVFENAALNEHKILLVTKLKIIIE